MTPAPPPPEAAAAAASARRIYFERLAATLLAGGVAGSRIGEIVAELDEHVAMAGVDPVEELGPVGDLAAVLVASTPDRRPWQSLAGDVLMGAAVGLTLAAAGALLFGRESGSDVVVWHGLVAYLTVFTAGIGLVRMHGSNNLIGRSRFEMPKLSLFVGFAAVAGLTAAVTRDWRWTLPAGLVVAILAIAAPLAALSVIWSNRRSRIAIPGRLRHLRRLQWGPFGR